VSGECGIDVAALGTSCDDGNNCTTGDACQGGICSGSGSGFVGPGEQCAPATPGTPGPFGDFHCLLEEVHGTDKNALTIGTGTLASTWILRGTMDFSFTASEAKLTKLSATGQQSRLSLQNGIVLMRDPSVASSGTVDMTSGNVQVSLPMLVRGSSGASMPLSLSLTGQIADRVLQGEATAPGGAGGRVKLFCREQFRNTVASATFQLDSTGNFVALGPISIFDGTPTMPGLRSIPASGDLIAELVSVTGEILDQYSVGQPWLGSRAGDVLAPTGASGIFNLQVRAPLSNRLGAVILRDSTGTTFAVADLTQSITDFCAGTGSQYCDYRTGAPVRTVFYAPHTPAPEVNRSFPQDVLPSSPRLDGDEVVITTDWKARQPDVALDADGNAVVVWREDYRKIMAKGIAKDGSILFGPTRINDVRCATGWIPGGYPPPDSTDETGDLDSQKPVVAVANTSDRTFAVAWGANLWLNYNQVPNSPYVPIICTRLMHGDGTPVSNPALVAPSLPGTNGSVLDEETYVDVAMTDSHEYLVAWSELPLGNNQHFQIATRRFGADGLPKTANAVVVSNDGSSEAVYPSVAMDKAGDAAIAWMSTTDRYPSDGKIIGQVKMQRFNSDSSKRGDNQLVQTAQLAGIPDVAFQPSGGSVLVTARSTDGDIFAGTFHFDDGTPNYAWSKVNSRTSGTQSHPVAVKTGDGGYMLAWMDEVGSGTSQVHPISGQVFDSSGVPVDIDFTISTQMPIFTDYSANNPDFYWIYDAFAFRAAASQSDYVLVWQRPLGPNTGTDDDPNYVGGIVLQRVKGGAPDCPSPKDSSGSNNCGSAVPLRITGGTDDSVDIVLSPGVDVDYDDRTFVQSWLTPRFSSTSEFVRTAVDMIVNGYWANSVFSKYANRLNFYYDMSQSYETNHFEGYICYELVAGQNGIQFNGNTAFTDVGVIVMKDYKATNECHESDFGLADGRDNANNIFTSSSTVAAMVHHPSDYSTLIHESGHATFGLREEYYYRGAEREDFHKHSNVFNSQDNCTKWSKTPDKCSAIGGVNNFWKSDPDTDAMSGGNGSASVYYGPDCQQRAQCWIEDIGCDY